MNSLPSFQACIQIQKLPFNAMIISSSNEELLHPIKSLGEACGISIQLDHSKLDVVSTEALLWANDQTKPNSRIQCLKFKLSVCTFKKLFDLGPTWLGCPILSSRTTVQRISRALETAGSKSSVGKGNLLPTWLWICISNWLGIRCAQPSTFPGGKQGALRRPWPTLIIITQRVHSIKQHCATHKDAQGHHSVRCKLKEHLYSSDILTFGVDHVEQLTFSSCSHLTFGKITF